MSASLAVGVCATWFSCEVRGICCVVIVVLCCYCEHLCLCFLSACVPPYVAQPGCLLLGSLHCQPLLSDCTPFLTKRGCLPHKHHYWPHIWCGTGPARMGLIFSPFSI